ncbi:MAG: hypothetical protein ABR920_12780, partial [Terriglobales bacterium]
PERELERRTLDGWGNGPLTRGPPETFGDGRGMSRPLIRKERRMMAPGRNVGMNFTGSNFYYGAGMMARGRERRIGWWGS